MIPRMQCLDGEEGGGAGAVVVPVGVVGPDDGGWVVDGGGGWVAVPAGVDCDGADAEDDGDAPPAGLVAEPGGSAVWPGLAGDALPAAPAPAGVPGTGGATNAGGLAGPVPGP